MMTQAVIARTMVAVFSAAKEQQQREWHFLIMFGVLYFFVLFAGFCFGFRHEAGLLFVQRDSTASIP
jgi:hypothetical protein